MAIQAVSNGDSIRQAAAEERVDRSLLRRRLLGVPFRDEFNESL
jgi:hypothetical protein